MYYRFSKLALALFLLNCFQGCSTVAIINPPTTLAPRRQDEASSISPELEHGLASYYSNKFAGRTTANGEAYHPHALSAAHRSLPFGTYVRVENLRNKKQVVVRINDRGPFTRGRIIDLSMRAARELSLVGDGVCEVSISIACPIDGDCQKYAAP